MAWTYVNGAVGGNDGSGTTIAAAAFNLTTGNIAIVAVGNYTPGQTRTVSSMTDTAGNSYTRAGNVYNPISGMNLEIWYKYNATGNATNVVTATFSGSATFRKIMVGQWSGIGTASDPWDSGYTPTPNGDTSSPYTSNSDTTAEDGELIVAYFQEENASNFSPVSSTGTIRQTLSGSDGVLADRLGASAGSFDIALTGSSSHTIAILAFAFKIAASGISIPVVMNHLKQQGIS